MNAIVDVGFDYALVPDGERDDVRSAAVRIKVRMSRTVEDIIEIGRDLIDVKRRLGHGNFLRWVEAEFGMAHSTASNFMNAASRFGEKVPTVGNLGQSVLYALAAPSTPDEVVDEAVERAAAGEQLSRDDIAAMKAEWEAERKALKAKADEYKFEAKDAKSTTEELSGQLEKMDKELAGLRSQREALEAQIARSGAAAKQASNYPKDETELSVEWRRKFERVWNDAPSPADRDWAREWVDRPIMDQRFA